MVSGRTVVVFPSFAIEPTALASLLTMKMGY